MVLRAGRTQSPRFGIAGHHGGHRGVSNIHHRIDQYEDEVHAETPPSTGGFRPFQIGGERQHVENQHWDKGEHDPGTVPPPAGARVVSQRADDGVVDRVPELRNENQQTDRRCVNQRNIGQEEYQVGADQRPAHIAGKVAAGVAYFARDIQLGILIHCGSG